MASKLTIVTGIRILHLLPVPRTIWATDDETDALVSKYKTHYDPELDLVQEVFAKIIANQKSGTAVQLMIEDDRYILRDPSFILPDVSAHLLMARSAAESMSSALDQIESSVTPIKAAKKERQKATKPRSKAVKKTKRGPKKKPRS